MRWMMACAVGALLGTVDAQEQSDATLIVQVSFVVQFQHHEGSKIFRHLKVGDPLQLVRERQNPADPNAVRVEWSGHVLGYVPDTANANLARQMDFGNRLRARVVRLSRHRDPDQRVEMEIYLPL